MNLKPKDEVNIHLNGHTLELHVDVIISNGPHKMPDVYATIIDIRKEEHHIKP